VEMLLEEASATYVERHQTLRFIRSVDELRRASADIHNQSWLATIEIA